MKDIVSILKKKSPVPAIKPIIRQFHASSRFSENWKVSGTHLVSNTPQIDVKEPVKVAAFDLDGTLIKTKSGFTFAGGADDWVFFNEKVVSMLKEVTKNGFLVVIFTNQGGMKISAPDSKSYLNFKGRVNQIVNRLSRDIEEFKPVVYASPGMPRGKGKKKIRTSPEELHLMMRKPQIGMWKEFVKGLGKEVDLENSFYVGDAAGREGDHSNSDRAFAETIDISFKTPEQYFKE